MQKLVREYLNELGRKQKKRRQFTVVAVLFAVLVVGSVIWGLAKVGIATTGEPRCGREEHQHTEGCYSSVLSCGLEESSGHQHTEDCWQTAEPALVCGLEESGEHTHTEECWQTAEPALVCGQEEYAGHTHTDGCYTEQLACGTEEHQHTEECYIDKSADVEDASVWNAQYENIEWENAWGKDLVTAAKLQLDYKESAANYTVAEDGSHKGYTRYGQFNGDPYADWDASFVNFCMYYAGLKTSQMFLDEKDTAEWYDKFVKDDEGKKIVYLTAPEGYEPQEGDIVFLKKENEETEFQMGIVSSYNKEDKEKNEFKVIEGNSENQVKENTYKIDDEHIFEYLKIGEMEKAYKESQKQPEPEQPEQPEQPAEDVQEPEEEPVIELSTEVDGVTITLFGPESSFEAGKEYTIQAEKVEDEEVLTTVEEAVEKVAEEKEKKVENFQPYDIRLLADGEEVQPLGPVSVKFSGQEVVEAVENEKTEVSVIHVDENTGKATDMEAAPTEEKEVVIETEHFSVYVYVNLTESDLFGEINVKVEHWGENITTIGQIKDENTGEMRTRRADASAGIDEVYTWKEKHINTRADLKTEIYTTDEISIPNEYYADIVELSKICNVKEEDVNYTATKVWISNNKDNEGRETWTDYKSYDLTSNVEIRDLQEGSLIRFWYTPKETKNNTFKTEANFYDYDITDGKYWDSTGVNENSKRTDTYKYIKTDEQGINDPDNFTNSGTAKLGVGQNSSGNTSDWAGIHYNRGAITWAPYSGWTDARFYGDRLNNDNLKRLNGGNGRYNNQATDYRIVEGIVQNTLDETGNLQYNVSVPKTLFKAGTGSTEYKYDLGFQQIGDTYTLQYVNDKSGNTLTNDLTEFGVYSEVPANLFWPLDNVNGKANRDPNIGATEKEYYYLKKNGNGWDCNSQNNYNLSNSHNDDKVAHNWHFGMTYQVDFTVGDYTGPMEFYFRGDDDFWLFIDDKLAIDIGGIHQSVGESIDLRAWMEEHYLLGTDEEGHPIPKDKTHTMKVFYMERGGYGSTCFIQFTLPQSVPVELPSMKETEYSLTKTWEDDNSPFRPEKVEITLVQEYETGETDADGNPIKVSRPTSEKIVLPDDSLDGKSWTYKWTGLPEVNGSTQGKYNYSYTAKEIGGQLPKGYESVIDPNHPGKMVNKLVPVSVRVAKEWVNDSEDLTKYRPDEVILRLYAKKGESGEWEAYQDTEGNFRDVTLKPNKEGIWESQEITNLPKYCNYELHEGGIDGTYYTYDKVFYSVREMCKVMEDGKEVLKEIEEGSQLAGKENARYKVSYSTGVPAVDVEGNQAVDADGNPVTLTATNTLLTKFRIVKRSTSEGKLNVEGAKFTLTPYVETNTGVINHLTEVLNNSDETEPTEPQLPTYDGISDENGEINWTDRETGDTEIKSGMYLMEEIEAPAGYLLSDVKWIVTVSKIVGEENSTIRATITLNDTNKTPVKPVDVGHDQDGELIFEYAFLNEVLYELPSTGGSGIYWHMFSGILLMSAAALITYRNKHRGVLRS